MGPPKTRRRRSGTAVQHDGFFFKLVSKHPDPVHFLTEFRSYHPFELVSRHHSKDIIVAKA